MSTQPSQRLRKRATKSPAKASKDQDGAKAPRTTPHRRKDTTGQAAPDQNHAGNGAGSKTSAEPDLAERLQNIPEDLRLTPQWVASAPSGKPIDVRTGRGAKCNDPSTWTDFDAVAAYCAKHTGYLPAFAFSEQDSYVGIDLDDKLDRPAAELDKTEIWDWVLKNTTGYAEVSRSGRGVHVVTKGNFDLPNGRGVQKWGTSVEIFKHGHFMTFTGAVIKDQVLQNCFAKLLTLVKKLEHRYPSAKATRGELLPAPAGVPKAIAAEEPDNVVVESALADPMTGERFRTLHEGDWTECYDSQSEADFAYVGMLWNASGDVAQVTRLWMDCQLAERKKGQRADYIAGMLDKVSQSPPRLRNDDSPASMFSDLANAKRLQHYFGDQLLYAPGTGWLVWDGARWYPNSLSAQRVAGKIGRVILGEAGRVAEQAARADNDAHADNLRSQAEALFKHAGRSENANKIDAALKLAAPLFECDPGKLDADPRLVGCTNGVVDLRTGKLSPSDPSQYITKSTGQEYDPAATCPTWDKTLARIFRKHPDVPAFMQRLAGYWLTGLTDPPYLAVLYGIGANGKTTVVETISHVLGDYATAAPRGLLTVKYGSGNPATELASLHGKRLVVTSETSEGCRLDEELIKAMTGSDRITARKLYHDYFTFSPTHKLALLTNHKPIVRGQDEGIWRRLLLVPFDEVIPRSEQDLALRDKLRAEAPGILAWMVKGAQAFLKSGITLPKVVTDATKAYRSDSDVIGTFIEEECEVSARAQVSSSQLYLVYERWCGDNGERPLPKRSLGLRLQDRGITSGKGAKGVRVLRGIALRSASKF